jgi:acyl CoA:acetate/3-ketoacid CoA transferase alpha subunit
MHLYEVRPRKDKRGVDLISDVLPFGRLWYGELNAASNAIGYAEHYSRSHDAVVRVYDDAGSGIEMHSQGPLVTRTETGAEAIPFATTSSSLGPVSCVDGTSKWVDTSALEATAMLL